MPTSTDLHEGAQMLTPASLPEWLPSRPVLSSSEDGWQDIVLQRFRHPPSTINVPGLRDNLVVDHLVGPVLIENVSGTKPHERRWTGPGQVTITPALQPVHRILKGHPEVVLVHLAPRLVAGVAEELFSSSPAQVVLVPSFAAPDPMADSIIRLLLAEAETATPGTRLMTETLARALVVHLLRRHSNLAPREPEMPVRITGARLRRVVEYMRAHMDEDLPLVQLANLSGLSPSRFACAFRDAAGQPPHKFLIGIRIEEARDLLEHTDLSVIEVGLRCGFGQPSHFATMFRKVTGLSPRAWRIARRS